MSILFDNNASGTLSVQAEIGHTTLTLQTNEAALYPSPTGSDFFYATLEDTSGNIEIVKVTDNDTPTTDVLTVTRAQENTTAKQFVVGSKVELRMTAATMDEFIQQSGDQMTGELDMNDQVLRDPVITDGHSRNCPMRGTDGGTSNQLTVPTAGADPTIGANTIVHTGNDSAYVQTTRTITGGEGISNSDLGDLSANRTVALDLTELNTYDAGDIAPTDLALVYDQTATEHKKVQYQDAGVRVVSTGDTTINLTAADMNTFYICTAATAITVNVDTGDGKQGNFLIFKQDNTATVTIAGSAIVTSAVGTTTRVQNSVITLVCEDDIDNWTLYGDGGG